MLTDYFGSVTEKLNADAMKRWIALFACFTGRAIHLELAEDLPAYAFLNVIRRFVARRGCPEREKVKR